MSTHCSSSGSAAMAMTAKTCCWRTVRSKSPRRRSRNTRDRLLIDAGVAAFNGIELPSHLVAPSVPMTANTVDDYYTLEDDETWTANFGAISSIPVTPE